MTSSLPEGRKRFTKASYRDVTPQVPRNYVEYFRRLTLDLEKESLSTICSKAGVRSEALRWLLDAPVGDPISEITVRKILDYLGARAISHNIPVCLGYGRGSRRGYLPVGDYIPGVTQAIAGEMPPQTLDLPPLLGVAETTEDRDARRHRQRVRAGLEPAPAAAPEVVDVDLEAPPEPEVVTPTPESPKAEVPGLKVEVKVTPVFDTPSEFRRSISERMAKFIALNVFTDEEVQEMLNTVARAALAKMAALTH